MLPFKLVYSDAYYLPIGEHVFPASKYRLVHDRLLERGIAEPADFIVPEKADDRDILLVHGADWVYKLQTGTPQRPRRIADGGSLLRRSWWRPSGSPPAAPFSPDAARCQDGVGISLGGGFHHAFPDHGEGFCMINDIAVAIRRLQKDKQIERALVIDCDVHQGNGTAVIFGRKRALALAAQPLPSVGAPVACATPSTAPFASSPPTAPTCSPSRSTRRTITRRGSRRLRLTSTCPTALTMSPISAGWTMPLSSALRQFQPQLISYVAGADPYQEDQLGGLNLTIEGLKRRDEFVFRLAKTRGIPVMVTLAGGYAQDVNDTITIHANTVVAAKEVFGS